MESRLIVSYRRCAYAAGLAVLATLGWLVAGPGPAGGAFPGTNGKIAYSNIPAGGGAADVWVMNADGSNPIQLTNDPDVDGNSAWSPDGTKIAFQSRRAGNYDIWVMNADGTNQTPLTTSTFPDLDPAWSPDGTKIAFDSTRSGDGEIWVMDADGSNQVNLSQEPNTAETGPSWSPDGTKVAFHSQRTIDSVTNTDIYVMNADGSGSDQRLTTDAKVDTSPDWSPDGTKIAFGRSTLGQNDSDIWVMDADGSDQSQLTSTAGNELGPAWSPDGTKIAFGGGGEVNVMNPDGTDPTALTTDPGTDSSPAWQISPPVNQSSPSIPSSAADGDTIACDPGTWTGASSFSYQWLRDGAPIAGATSSNYTLTSDDVGKSILCRVTATNSAGSASADSNALVPSAASAPGTEPTDDPVTEPTEDDPLTITELNATDPPKLGREANVAPTKGEVFVSVPVEASAWASQLTVPGLKGREFVPLEEARQIPIGSFLDTREGTVAVFTSRNRKRTRLQSGRFASGVFQVLQSRKRRAKGLTTLQLKGFTASFEACSQGKNVATASLSRKKIRRLRAKAKGRYRTRSKYSAATVRGTTWTATDSCAGTLTEVKRGKVAVRDFRRKKTIVVTAGKKYLARAPR